MGAERVMNFKTDGLKIEYDLYGEGGRLIVILHGWGCAKEMFRPAAERLAKNGYTVAVPDLCGFGQSAEPPRPFSVGDYAAVFTKFIESFGARPVSLIGHSFGGRIIFKLYEQKHPPFLVERVMLIDAAGIRPKKTARQRISLLGYKIGRRFLSLPPLARCFPDAVENWRKRRGSADYSAVSGVMRQTLVLAVNEDLTHCMKNIDVPTLLFWGERDDATPLSDAKKMEKLIPDAGLVVVRDGSHFSFLDDAPLFFRVLDAFFGFRRSACGIWSICFS